MAKKNAVISPVETTPGEATTEHKLSFGDFSVIFADLPQATQRRLAEYGFGKMLQDAASGTVKRVTMLGEALASGTEAASAAYEKKYGEKPDHTEYTGFQAAHPEASNPEEVAKAVAKAQQAGRFLEMLDGKLGTRAASTPRLIGIEKFRVDAAKALLAAKIKAMGKVLPKVDTDDYKGLLAKIQARFPTEIEEAAQAAYAAHMALQNIGKEKPAEDDDWMA